MNTLGKNILAFVLLMGILLSCENKTANKSNSKKSRDSTVAGNGEDKSYLQKRPEEFKEFFLLSSELPFKGKVATKKDVQDGKAVFNLDSKGDTTHHPLDIKIPFFAFLNKPGKKSPNMVVIMQAETLRGDTILGYRESNGHFGICSPRELEYFQSSQGKVY